MVKLSSSINLTASDVTGQKHVRLHQVPTHTSVREFTEGLLPRMRLHQLDHNGNPVHYEVRLEREARHVHGAEIVGEALQDADHIILHPRISAGGASPSPHS